MVMEESHEKEKIVTRKHKRRGTKRSRSGCNTCKIRRVKCGEERPSCLRCTSTGRKCDEYGDVETVSRSDTPYGYQLMKFGTKIPLVISQSIIPGTPQEQQSFDFFRTKSATDFCGFFGSSFWNYFVFQAIHTEPAIRHAAIALGALQQASHVARIYSGDEILKREFAFRQYSMAMRHLAQHIAVHKERSASVALMSCLLFFAFESFQSRFDEAKKHLQSGMNITTLIKDKQTRSDLEDLMKVFRRLALQSPFFGLEVPQQLFEEGKSSPNPSDCKESSFSSLENAREGFYACLFQTAPQLQNFTSVNTKAQHAYLKCPLVDLDGPYESQSFEERTVAKLRLEEWFTKFQSFLKHSNRALSLKDRQGVALLKLHYLFALTVCVSIRLDMSTDFDEMDFDEYKSGFETMIQLSEYIINSSVSTAPSMKFILDAGVLAPLHFLVMKCRDPQIRRRALRCMEISPFRESLWDSKILIALGKRIIEIEEGRDYEMSDGLCETIPAERRLFWALVELRNFEIGVGSDERCGVLHFTRRMPNGEFDSDGYFTELITW